MIGLTEAALDARARRAAKRIGLVARKSRRRVVVTIDDFGGFCLVDSHLNLIVAGEKYDLDAEAVVEYCEPGGVIWAARCCGTIATGQVIRLADRR
jgi:hypothetical protein